MRAVDLGSDLLIDDSLGLVGLLDDELLDGSQERSELFARVGEDVVGLGAERNVCGCEREGRVRKSAMKRREEGNVPGLAISSLTWVEIS